MFDKILLAVDGSEEAKRAVDAAIGLAKTGSGEVTVFHVIEREISRAGSFDLETSDEVTELVDATVRRVKDEGVSARGELRRAIHGRAAHEILNEAKAEGADVIVMGSRGLSDLSGLLLGSVTHKVIHMAEIPVLVVR